MTLTDFPKAARTVVRNTIRVASRAIDAELYAPPPRQPVSYGGRAIDTHARFLARKARYKGGAKWTAA